MAEPDVEQPGEENPGTVEEEGKKGNLLMILLPLMLLSAGGGAFLSYTQYDSIATMMAEREAAKMADAADADPIIEYGEFLELSNIVVNPVDSDGRRLLMISLGIETDDAAALETVGAREMVVRDTIIRLLGRHTVEELSRIEARTAIKDELKAAVNGIIQEGEINRMYFTQYVIQ